MCILVFGWSVLYTSVRSSWFIILVVQYWDHQIFLLNYLFLSLILYFSFFWLLFAWSIFFYFFTFNLFVPLNLKWISYRQCVAGSLKKSILPISFVRGFSPSTLNKITDKEGFIFSIFVLVFYIFLVPLLSFHSCIFLYIRYFLVYHCNSFIILKIIFIALVITMNICIYKNLFHSNTNLISYCAKTLFLYRSIPPFYTVSITIHLYTFVPLIRFTIISLCNSILNQMEKMN